jgi:hypothetical protein
MGRCRWGYEAVPSALKPAHSQTDTRSVCPDQASEAE